MELGLVDPNDQADKTRTLLNSIGDGSARPSSRRASLQEIASTPLMLSLMAGVHARRPLPDSRAELYDQLVKDLLNDLWKSSKGEPNAIQKLLEEVGIQINELKFLLAKLAFELHERALELNPQRSRAQPGADIHLSRRDLKDGLLELSDPARSTVEWADKVARALEERAGLLLAVDDHAFKFPHRSFQEFFGGVHLSRDEGFAKRGRERLFKSEHRIGAPFRSTLELAANRRTPRLRHCGASRSCRWNETRRRTADFRPLRRPSCNRRSKWIEIRGPGRQVVDALEALPHPPFRLTSAPSNMGFPMVG